MDWGKPVLVGTLGMASLIFLAYLCGTFLGTKPFSWDRELPLPKSEIYDSMQGKWRPTLVKVGGAVVRWQQTSPAQFVKIDKDLFQNLVGGGLPIPYFDSTIALDITRDPTWFDLTNKKSGQVYQGVVEMSQDKNHIRFLMRLSTSTSGRPTDFQSRQSDDFYWEYAR